MNNDLVLFMVTLSQKYNLCYCHMQTTTCIVINLKLPVDPGHPLFLFYSRLSGKLNLHNIG